MLFPTGITGKQVSSPTQNQALNAILCFNKKVDISTIQEPLGNSSIKTTMVYAN